MDADVVVIGGGLSGTSVAFHLARAGQQVVLVERDELASAASGASTGWATVHFASYMPVYEDEHMRLMAKGLELFVELAEPLADEIDYQQTGGLSLVYSEAELAEKQALASRLEVAGIPAEVVGREQVLELEPGLGGPFVGALYSPREALVDAPALVHALARRAATHGAEILTRTTALGIELREREVAAVETTAGRIRTSAVVNAAGLDAPRVGSLVGIEIPLFPSRGQQLVLSAPRGLVGRAVYSPGIVRPTREGYIVGGLREQSTYRNEMTLGGVSRLAEQALAMVPGLSEARLAATLPGLRPVPSDGKPIYGPVPGVRGFYLANLHFGLTLVALTGRVLASYVLGEKPGVDVSGYGLDRFAREPNVSRHKVPLK
jgi:glycine/D-amino acid oxidase-like deaminating enzyme